MPSQNQNTATAQKSTGSTTPPAEGVGTYARQAVDLQVGAALTAADRVRELVAPWRSRQTAEKELKSIRQQLSREASKVERRGGTARRRFTDRVSKTRNRFERDVSARRRKAEQRIKSARTQVSDRVSAVV
jgi:Skp family chaperone for outer membrane proteins